jgi:hypothetical protein
MADPVELFPAPLLSSLDYVWGRIEQRLAGLTTEEYLWEPAAGCWSIRSEPDGPMAEYDYPEPEPPPVTTIAWRTWHIGLACLAEYTEKGLGSWPLPVRGRQWYLEADEAIAAMRTAWQSFRAGLGRLGQQGMASELGPDWGPYQHDTWAGLVLHAQDELSHHGAEIALLRDLYRASQ